MSKLMSVSAVAFMCLLGASYAKPVWDTTYGAPDRRLGVEMTQSSSSNDTGCIVGGYDTADPSLVYVGGPCSEMKTGGPSEKFRYVAMKTVELELENDAGKKADLKTYGNAVKYGKEDPNYAEVGVGVTMHFKDDKTRHAAMFASTTSYLSKSAFGFTKNSFVIGKDDAGNDEKLDVCVSKCCAAPGDNGCDCANNACSTTEIKASPGDYKYSLFAAAYDGDGTIGTGDAAAYVAGETGNGWARVTAEHGSGDPKKLKGYLSVFQGIDFTNMKADTLTITQGSTSTTYSSMKACDLETFKDGDGNDCVPTPVGSMTVASGEWTGTYTFPSTFNRGTWSKDASDVITATPGDSQTVIIECVRVKAANLVALGIAADADKAAAKKVVLLRYKFKVHGISGAAKTGKYMVYDPTVTTGTGGGGGGSGGGGGGTAKISAGRFTAMPAFVVMILGAIGMSM